MSNRYKSIIVLLIILLFLYLTSCMGMRYANPVESQVLCTNHVVKYGQKSSVKLNFSLSNPDSTSYVQIDRDVIVIRVDDGYDEVYPLVSYTETQHLRMIGPWGQALYNSEMNYFYLMVYSERGMRMRYWFSQLNECEL